MSRKFDQKKLVVASHNDGKVREISALLEPFGVEVSSAKELDLPEPVEDGATFVANAELKAHSATEHSGLVSLADDSGLVVAGLDGEPGIYSARWAVNPATDKRDFPYGMKKIFDELDRRGSDDRSAYFVCVLSLAWPDGHVESFEGRVYGTLVWPARGDNGFGYDPVFLPDGHDQTFGEMAAAQKHDLSHRANAFAKLIDASFQS